MWNAEVYTYMDSAQCAKHTDAHKLIVVLLLRHHNLRAYNVRHHNVLW